MAKVNPGEFFNQVKAETAKVVWPTRRETLTTALMVVIMSFEIVPIGYELHFTVLTGMIVGPWYGGVAALLFNLLRALIGDGAFTNIGLNTVITWLEIALGAATWATLRPLLQRRLRSGRPAIGVGPVAGLATFVSLFLATVAFVGLIGLSMVDARALVETGAYDVEAGGFGDAPFAGGLINVHLSEAHEDSESDAGAQPGFTRFAVAILVLGAIGAAIEATVVGAVAAFIARVRPDLLGLRPATLPAAP